MSETYDGVSKHGFKTMKEYVDYMTKHSLWGGDEYIKSKGTWDKRLVKEAEE